MTIIVHCEFGERERESERQSESVGELNCGSGTADRQHVDEDGVHAYVGPGSVVGPAELAQRAVQPVRFGDLSCVTMPVSKTGQKRQCECERGIDIEPLIPRAGRSTKSRKFRNESQILST